jgi:hypothetical protein
MSNAYFMEQMKDLIFDFVITNDKYIQKVGEIIREYDPSRIDFCSLKDMEVYEGKIDKVVQRIKKDIPSIPYYLKLPTEEEIRAIFE